jgi:hypothetical protein
MKEFKDWDWSTSKNWTNLKMFVQGAYARRLVAVNLHSAAAQNGHVTQNNMFHILCDDKDEFKGADSTGAMATHTATAATANSGITAPTVHADVVTAINTLSANQVTILQQMAAFSLGGSRTAQQAAAPAIQVPLVPRRGTYLQLPPIQAVHVPMILKVAGSKVVAMHPAEASKDVGVAARTGGATDAVGEAAAALHLLIIWWGMALSSHSVVATSLSPSKLGL